MCFCNILIFLLILEEKNGIIEKNIIFLEKSKWNIKKS